MWENLPLDVRLPPQNRAGFENIVTPETLADRDGMLRLFV
jgi:hypothetical protein